MNCPEIEILPPDITRETIQPDDHAAWLKLRGADITSTQVSALFGLSPYMTKFELWHSKRNGEGLFPVEENERMRWGTRYEPVTAQGVCDDMGWHGRPMKEYMRLPELRIGSSFDWRVVPAYADDQCMFVESDADLLLEIKHVDFIAFRDGWIVDGDWIDAPAHIEWQVQHQMLVSGLRRAVIAVMVNGNDLRLIEREADPDAHRMILDACAAFWQSIEANEPPPAVMPGDADAVIALNQYAKPGKLLDATKDAELTALVKAYQRLGREIDASENDRKVMKADILQRIGEADRVLLGERLKLSAGMVSPSEGTLITPDMVGTRVGGRKGYRGLRVGEVKA